MPAAASDGERFDVTLDIDRDGKPDRAVLEHDPDAGLADLSIYLDAGEGPLDASHEPKLVKNDLAAGGFVALEVNDQGSLLFSNGCGGCSNDYETTLTIVHRDGAFMVGGYSYVWDTRNGAGACEINYLTGKGYMQHGVDGEAVALEGIFEPVTLSEWTDEHRPLVCEAP